MHIYIYVYMMKNQLLWWGACAHGQPTTYSYIDKFIYKYTHADIYVHIHIFIYICIYTEEPTSLIGYLRSRAATTVSLLKRNENFQKLSSMEAEWWGAPVYTDTSIHTLRHAHICICIYMNLCIYVYLDIIWIYVCMYIRICICIYVYVYKYIYI